MLETIYLVVIIIVNASFISYRTICHRFHRPNHIVHSSESQLLLKANCISYRTICQIFHRPNHMVYSRGNISSSCSYTKPTIYLTVQSVRDSIYLVAVVIPKPIVYFTVQSVRDSIDLTKWFIVEAIYLVVLDITKPTYTKSQLHILP